VWKKLTVMENRKWKSGFFDEGDKSVYVTRGVGSVFSFRWFSPPEIVLATVEG
jgi:predicted MPP superfamily phosphohydrolase